MQIDNIADRDYESMSREELMELAGPRATEDMSRAELIAVVIARDNDEQNV